MAFVLGCVAMCPNATGCEAYVLTARHHLASSLLAKQLTQYPLGSLIGTHATVRVSAPLDCCPVDLCDDVQRMLMNIYTKPHVTLIAHASSNRFALLL